MPEDLPQGYYLENFNYLFDFVGTHYKTKDLKETLSQIEKQFGKGSVMKLGQSDALKGISVISTGSISLDNALGVRWSSSWPYRRNIWSKKLLGKPV